MPIWKLSVSRPCFQSLQRVDDPSAASLHAPFACVYSFWYLRRDFRLDLSLLYCSGDSSGPVLERFFSFSAGQPECVVVAGPIQGIEVSVRANLALGRE